jgi:hypothetical protein
VDGRRTLDQLCDLGPMSPGINARVLYALNELGILGRSELLPGHIKIQVKNVPE